MECPSCGKPSCECASNAGLDKPLKEWTINDVRKWLESLDLREYCENFKRTNGSRLLALTEAQFEKRFPKDIEAAQTAWIDLQGRINPQGKATLFMKSDVWGLCLVQNSVTLFYLLLLSTCPIFHPTRLSFLQLCCQLKYRAAFMPLQCVYLCLLFYYLIHVTIVASPLGTISLPTSPPPNKIFTDVELTSSLFSKIECTLM